MDDKDNVKYNEEQFVLNKSNEEINDKKLQENELKEDEYGFNDDLNEENDNKENENKKLDEKNINDSQLFEDNYLDISTKKENDNINENNFDKEKEKENPSEKKEEAKNEISDNNKNNDIRQEEINNNKPMEDNKINEEDKDMKNKEEKKEDNKNENEDILNKKEAQNSMNEENELNKNNKEIDIKKEEKKNEYENIQKKEEKGIGGKENKEELDDKNSIKDSEHIIDSIIRNELNAIHKENVNKSKKNISKGKVEKKYTTLKDLENSPFKKMKIDSPRSLQLIHMNKYTPEELCYNPERQLNNFYEKLRLDKIKKLSELRDKLIQEEKFENNMSDDEIIKNLILSTQEKILDDNLERIKTRNEIELANIVKYELDKNLSRLELKKSADNFKKEKLKLKPYEIILNKRNKASNKNKRYKTLENNTPIITNLKSQNDNIKSFYIGKRQNEFCFYNQKLNQKLEKIELIKLKRNELFKLKKNMETERAKINLKKSEDKLNLKLENLKKKMEWKNFMTIVIKNVIKKVQIEKREINNQKSLMKKEYINNLKNIEQKEREKKLEILNKKGEKRGDIKNSMGRIYSSRIDKYHNLEKERKINISKIQQTLKNGEGENEKNLDKLMEDFPDNYRISDVIKDYQMKKNEIENNQNIKLYSSIGNLYNGTLSPYRTLTSNNNLMNKSYDKKRIFIYSTKNKKKEKINTKKNESIKKEERRINNMNNESRKIKNEEMKDEKNDIYNENELKEKIRTFKLQLYKNFLKKVKQEKNKEIMRKKQLEMINDSTLRNNLEIQFSDERALIDMRLRKENENLRKIAKDYENKLKNNFLKKQDRILNLVKEINEKKEIKE